MFSSRHEKNLLAPVILFRSSPSLSSTLAGSPRPIQPCVTTLLPPLVSVRLLTTSLVAALPSPTLSRATSGSTSDRLLLVRRYGPATTSSAFLAHWYALNSPCATGWSSGSLAQRYARSFEPSPSIAAASAASIHCPPCWS